MGIVDSIKDKLINIPGYTKPLTDVSKVLDNTVKPPVEAKTPQQVAYEANEKYMNRNNPGYVPRAKGGPVKKGGATWNGQPVKKV